MAEPVIIRAPDGRAFVLSTDEPARRWREVYEPAGYTIVRGTVPDDEPPRASPRRSSRPRRQSGAESEEP